MKNTTTTSKFPLPTDIGWARLPERVLAIETHLSQEASGGVGLEGSDYVYVSANGTPTENAIELQAAYDLAKVKVDYQESIQPLNVGAFSYSNGNLYLYDYNLYVQNGGVIEDGILYELLFDGVSYFATTYMGGMMWEFLIPAPIDAPYTTLEILINTSTYNLVTVVVAPGKYSFASDFIVDAEYVNITSLTGNRDILFTGNGTIEVDVNGILVKGIDTLDKQFIVGLELQNTIFENCGGGQKSFSKRDTYSYLGGTIDGTYINCSSKSGGFGEYSFAAGTYKNCVAESGQAFGCYGGAIGTFIDCSVPDNAQAFGLGGTASGIFENCKAGAESFGGYSGSTGTFRNCVGSYGSFGGQNNGTVINGGRLYYCTMTQGTFPPVSNGGRTYYCIDGNGNTNNQ
jgi:hypothetical protein